ncbi:DNA ligase [Pirellulimonas nuda]|uniref:DNA ligase n=1 Tax=Pirellulimonas nuda TaxID=2528009 RepID=A0A518D625_9BACT|nr:tetratricopeptide repeat protein [Pirellulimonas nuda]QDU86920.1 DNA ligase [Pirellulimonas nuda]
MSTTPSNLTLEGERVAFVGPLASMPRRDAAALVRQAGAEVARGVSASVTLLVVGDETADWRSVLGDDAALIESAQIVSETQLWQRLGLIESEQGVRSLYTPAMLAEMVGVPPAMLRRWVGRGHLRAARTVGRMPYFDFGEAAVARRLAELLAAGCSAARIDRLVAELQAAAPELDRPLVQLSIVVEDGALRVRRGDDLTEPSGQRLLNFDASVDEPADVLQLTTPRDLEREFCADGARNTAAELEAAGDVAGAIAACRAVLMSGQGDAADQFTLAELLYRVGDLPAARERYYATLEQDEDYVEARANLGCVLAEQGELELAAASFRGALDCHPDFADARYHLALTLEDLGRTAEAIDHWRRFLAIAPESPWAEEARRRLEQSAAEAE